MKKLAVGILAHVDAGKTTLSEGLLYLTGKIKKLGRVDHRDCFLDTHALERQRGITIFSKQAVFATERVEVTLLDTPGHVDFSSEMERTLDLLDYAILVVSGTDGVQAHTETLWRLLRRYGVPTFLFVTKMDAAGADRAARMKELKERFGSGCVDFAAESAERAEEIALLDEPLLDRFLEGGEITRENMAALVRQRLLFPCYFGSGLKLDGVEALLRGLEDYTLQPVYPTDFGARVYKIARDPQGNRLTFLKVTGGSLRVRQALRYCPRGAAEPLEEKISQLRLYYGDRFETAEEVPAGGICAALGLSATLPGDGLGAETASAAPALEPVMAYRLRLGADCDPRTALPKLLQLQEEDPQLHIAWNERLREIQVRLMGEVQIEILKSLIAQRFGLDAEVDEGRILYRETIAAAVEGVGHYEPLRHYAEVHLLLEPLPRGSGLEFASACSEDVLDRSWQRLILTHLEEKPHLGVLTGSPVTDMRLTLVAGRSHLKHTEGGDFREATYRAVRQGLMRAESVLLEPIYAFRLAVPPEQIGRAINDIRAMNGTFSAPAEAGELLLLVGRAPVSAMRSYQAEVTAYTRGRGRLSCRADGYAVCPNAQAVIAESGYDPQRDTENPADSVFCAHGAGFLVKWDQVEDYMHLDSGLRLGKEAQAETAEPAPRVYTRSASIDEREVEAILQREFGPIRRKEYRAATEITPAAMSQSYTKKKNYLIVDGYNLLFAWEGLKELARENLEAARHRLLELLSNYRGYTGCTLIVVFDGYLVKGNTGTNTDFHGVHVVYTKEGESGDLYIEKLLREIGKNDSVRVATSDGLIQLAALRDGVQRLSSRELIAEIESVQKQITEAIARSNRTNP